MCKLQIIVVFINPDIESKNNFMQKPVIQIPASLIKYDAPIHVSDVSSFKISKGQDLHEGKVKIKEILNVIWPPRQFLHQINGKQSMYLQYVESDKLKRQDVDSLKDKLQGFLEVQKARQEPICLIREQIFSQAFDEIIRQVVIDCPERGVVLNRVKNELLLTLLTYNTVYEQSLGFSRRKLNQTQQGMHEMQKQRQQLVAKQLQLQHKHKYLMSKKQSIDQNCLETRTLYKQKRDQEIQALEFQQDHLKMFFQMIKKAKDDEYLKQMILIGDKHVKDIYREDND